VAIVFLGLTAAFGGNQTVTLLVDWIVVTHIALAELCLGHIIYNPFSMYFMALIPTCPNTLSYNPNRLKPLFLHAHVTGSWLERAGPRRTASVAAVFWGGGLALSALAVQSGTFPLLLFGFGVCGGIGLGLGEGINECRDWSAREH